jgi:hypothetical protein
VVAYLALNFVSKMFLTLGPGMTEFMEKYKEEIQGFRKKTFITISLTLGATVTLSIKGIFGTLCMNVSQHKLHPASQYFTIMLSVRFYFLLY